MDGKKHPINDAELKIAERIAFTSLSRCKETACSDCALYPGGEEKDCPLAELISAVAKLLTLRKEN